MCTSSSRMKHNKLVSQRLEVLLPGNVLGITVMYAKGITEASSSSSLSSPVLVAACHA